MVKSNIPLPKKKNIFIIIIFIFISTANVKRVAFERRKLIKLSTETIKYDKYPFASME